MKKNYSIGTRFLGFLLVAVFGAVLLAFPLKAKREEERVRAVLLEIQEALQNYHVQEEVYPRRAMSGHELVGYLAEREFLSDAILNPWTKRSYLEEGEDWLRYRTDQRYETYELLVYHQDSEEVRFRLDSTENQSLE